VKTKAEINEKIKVIARNYISDGEAMLFGSRARNDACDDSDYDILIVTGKVFSIEEKTVLRTNIRKGLLSEGIRSDILIQNKTEIERKKRLPGHVIRNIMKDAIML
jgi:predicted nucleotidyltransferase